MSTVFVSFIAVRLNYRGKGVAGYISWSWKELVNTVSLIQRDCCALQNTRTPSCFAVPTLKVLLGMKRGSPIWIIAITLCWYFSATGDVGGPRRGTLLLLGPRPPPHITSPITCAPCEIGQALVSRWKKMKILVNIPTISPFLSDTHSHDSAIAS